LTPVRPRRKSVGAIHEASELRDVVVVPDDLALAVPTGDIAAEAGNMHELPSSRCLPGSATIGKFTLAGAPIGRDTVMRWLSLPAMIASMRRALS
jgi:hypothetical protein